MKKTYLAILTAAVMSLSLLAGCQGEKTKTATTTAPSAAAGQEAGHVASQSDSASLKDLPTREYKNGGLTFPIPETWTQGAAPQDYNFFVNAEEGNVSNGFVMFEVTSLADWKVSLEQIKKNPVGFYDLYTKNLMEAIKTYESRGDRTADSLRGNPATLIPIKMENEGKPLHGEYIIFPEGDELYIITTLAPAENEEARNALHKVVLEIIEQAERK